MFSAVLTSVTPSRSLGLVWLYRSRTLVGQLGSGVVGHWCKAMLGIAPPPPPVLSEPPRLVGAPPAPGVPPVIVLPPLEPPAPVLRFSEPPCPPVLFSPLAPLAAETCEPCVSAELPPHATALMAITNPSDA